MNLGSTFSCIIPIVSHARQRPERAAPVPVPEAGARFGRASAFSFSAAGAEAGGGGAGPRLVGPLPDQPPPEYMRIIRASASVVPQEVRVEDPDAPGAHADLHRHERLRFGFTEYPPKPTRASLQPAVRTQYDLIFRLHPEAEGAL